MQHIKFKISLKSFMDIFAYLTAKYRKIDRVKNIFAVLSDSD